MARIHHVIGEHFSTAPRLQKQAIALRAAGHEVSVSTVWFDEEKAAQDQILARKWDLTITPALDFRPHRRWTRFTTRLGHRLARELFQRGRICSGPVCGYGTHALYTATLRQCPELTLVHHEVGLWVGKKLQQQGWRVGIDFEDWFSRDLLPAAQRTRPLAQMEHLQARLAQTCTYCLATSHAMARALAEAYAVPLPTVIYNSFPALARPHPDGRFLDRTDRTVPSLHWFSKTVGEGRGLETLFAALPLLQNRAQVFLRGDCSSEMKRWMDRQIPPDWRERVTLLPPVLSEELPSRIAEHDIGLALETDSIPSRNLTVTYKLFQYLQAGLTIVATETLGQREILGSSLAGRIVPQKDPAALAAALDLYLSQPKALAAAKKTALALAEGVYAWERQLPIIQELAARALENKMEGKQS